MKATIRLEYFGKTDDERLRFLTGVMSGALGRGVGEAVVGKIHSRRPWVAEIMGTDPRYGLRREFLDANTSYRHANGCGSRGTKLWFVLESGKYYEVKEQTSWRSSERYFCRVSASGDIIRAIKEEVMEWAKSR